MQSLTADLSHVSVQLTYIEITDAAHLLARHLPEGFDHWIDHLRVDLCNSRVEDGDCEFSWQCIEGLQYCFAPQLYALIALRNPKSLGVGMVGEVDKGSPYYADHFVKPCVDYEHGARLLVDCQIGREHDPSATPLTPTEAIGLAQKLLNAAEYCNTYDYHIGTCQVIPKSYNEDASKLPSVGTTGDPEVDALLKELEGLAGPAKRSKKARKRVKAKKP